MNIEAQEVYQFTCSIYFSLKGVFALPQHGCCIYVWPVGSSNKIGGFQKYACPIFPTEGGPGLFC